MTQEEREQVKIAIHGLNEEIASITNAWSLCADSSTMEINKLTIFCNEQNRERNQLIARRHYLNNLLKEPKP